MALNKPNEYNEIETQQNETVIYAENINQIIVNTEKLKGGSADEKPVSSIKELYQKINALEKRIEAVENKNPPSEDNNQNLLDTYNLEVRNANDLEANIDKKHNFVLEKKKDKYILKGSIRTKIPKLQTLELVVSKIRDIENFTEIFAVLAQFIEAGRDFTTLENQITVKEKDASQFLFNSRINYRLVNADGMPSFIIYLPSQAASAEKEYDINFNIEINNADIRNMKDYIVHTFINQPYSYLKLEKSNERTLLKGDTHIGLLTQQEGGILASKEIEKYFNIQNDKNDAHFKITDGISSSRGKKIKYYIRKENVNISATVPFLKDYSIYYLHIKYEDGTQIPVGETFTLNLQTDK